METITTSGFKPICILPNQRAKPRNNFQIPTLPPRVNLIPSTFETSPPRFRKNIARSFHGSLVLGAKFVGALTYEEALEQSVNINSAADFDAVSVLDSILDNPVLLAGGVAIIAVPLIVSQVLGGKPTSFGVVSAKSAYAKLADDLNAQLLDLRSSKDLREVGIPDIRGLKKKPVTVVYKGEDKAEFLDKLSLMFKELENTTLYILDKFDGNSEVVAKLVTANGFKSAYAIKDGVEGPRGWLNSGMPWILPQKTFSLNLSGLSEAFSGTLDGVAGALPGTLGLAAMTGLGLLAFTELETLLQLLGSVALVQFISKKLLFAEDRKRTLQQLDEFLNTKVAPKELVSDIKQIATAFLPTTTRKPSLPAPMDATSEPPAVANKAETFTEQPAPLMNSTPENEVKAGSHPRALSPYPAYPDLKPPTSPCPSPPSG